MPDDARPPQEALAREAEALQTTQSNFAEKLRRLKDRADVARIDGVRSVRDRTAMAASAGRAQVERAQNYVSFQARRRPLAVTGLAAAAGVIIGAALWSRVGSPSRRSRLPPA